MNPPKIPGYKGTTLPRFTPEQMQLFQSLFGHLGEGSFLSKLAQGDESAFAEMEAPALKQFSGQLGNLASRFSGQGLGGRHSSGFMNESSNAASNFAQQLASQRNELKRQALSELMGYSNQLLGQQPYEYRYLPKEKSFWEKLFGTASGLGGAALGGAFGGMPGAQLGLGIGNQIGKGFL